MCLLLAAGICLAGTAQAGVAVLANRTDEKVYFAVATGEGAMKTVPLEAREVMTLEVDAPLPVAVYLNDEWRQVTLPLNSIHYFVRTDDRLALVPVGLPDAPVAAAALPAGERRDIATIPVMLLVDEEEPLVRKLWEKRLRDRLQGASRIFERTCRVRFEAVAVGTWMSDNAMTRFERSLEEFESKVNPAPARVAIGFTSQYQIPKGRVHMGGTRGPMHSHVLIREWSNHVTEPERLEILVHELGHFLGAIHSPEPDSVMRPTLGDRRAHARDFRIGFDPGNAFAMFMVGEELRRGEVASFGHMGEPTKAWLRAIYRGMAPAMPDDESAAQYIAALASPAHRALPQFQPPKSLVEATRTVVQAIASAAEANARLPLEAGKAPGIDHRASGDVLAELYVRRAASAASRLPPDRAAKAFVLGVGIGLDRSTLLRQTPLLSGFCRQVETDEQWKRRLDVLGTPTMHDRADLSQHFALSAFLTALAGPALAESAGTSKELGDARGGTGFSFADMAANLSGIQFARQTLDNRTSLAGLATGFTIGDCVSPVRGLKENLAWDDFVAQYGSTSDERYHREIEGIRQTIAGLPGYAKPEERR